MECKLNYLSAFLSVLHELIETLWNVNEIKVKARLTDDKELIETLWNVNEGRQKTFYFGNVN